MHWFRDMVDHWQTLVAGVIGGGLTLAAGILAYRGARGAAQQQIAEDKERAREVERAYVSGGGWRLIDRRLVEPDDADLGDLYEQSVRTVERGDEMILSIPSDRFELHINNHGKTPARLHHVAVGFCDASALPPEPVYQDPFPWRDAIGPGMQSRVIKTVDIPVGRYARTAICGRYYWEDIWGRH
jgi:hypothetical protein